VRRPLIPKERRAEALLALWLVFGILLSALPGERTLAFAHDLTARANAAFLATFQWAFDLAWLAGENRDLRHRLAVSELRVGQLEEEGRQNERLRGLLAFGERAEPEVLTGAEVVGWGDGRQAFTVTIAAGSAEGVERDQAVVTAAGLAGRIERVTGPHHALVSLLNDPTNAVAAVVERTREQGIFRFLAGTGSLEFILQAADVQVGDRILSSGRGGVYPPGLLIGTVESVADDPDRVTKRVTVALSVLLDRLEEVYVLRGGVRR
jgi:rod shape-determining protein MreC